MGQGELRRAATGGGGGTLLPRPALAQLGGCAAAAKRSFQLSKKKPIGWGTRPAPSAPVRLARWVVRTPCPYLVARNSPAGRRCYASIEWRQRTRGPLHHSCGCPSNHGERGLFLLNRVVRLDTMVPRCPYMGNVESPRLKESNNEVEACLTHPGTVDLCLAWFDVSVRLRGDRTQSGG